MSKVQKSLKYEDTIQCFFFSTKKKLDTEWQQQCGSINETIKCLSQEYIWHRDEFKVFLPINEEKNDIPIHLMSVTCFGDNVEDEWFIVYLLMELTKKFPDLIIQIEDNDGDFLLIEAADYLPTWANPETTENRVFIFEHNVHIISPNIVPLDLPLRINDALILIGKKSEETKGSQEIQRAIYKRINNYPQQIKENSHKSILKLPLEVAAVLTLKPSLISSIVNTFCSLDALDAKLCKDLKTDDFIKAEVKFTKFLYAMLMHTKFPNSFKFKTQTNDKKTDLGLKLLCGYRTIMAKTSEDIFSTSEYHKFIYSLSKNGYFKNNLEGSKEYIRLLNEAKNFFNMECPISSYVCNVINEIKATDEFKDVEKSLKQKNNEDFLAEDDDSWLNIHPDQLNEFLNNQYGRKVKINNNDPITSHIITSELSNFLNQRSDLEGIEETMDDNKEVNIDFNSDEFVSCLEKMLHIISKGNLTNDSDQSDFSDDNDDDSFVEVNKEISELDRELASKLTINVHNENNEEAVLQNLMHSLKEEGLSGPTSTVLRTVGIKKSDLIDSDDDDDIE